MAKKLSLPFARRQAGRSVGGHYLPSPLLTRRAAYYVVLYLGLPLVVVPLLADILLYFLFARLLSTAATASVVCSDGRSA